MPQPTLAQIGATIRKLRDQRKLTIEGLADEAGLHTVSISRIEVGGQNLTWNALSDIATALDVEPVELVNLAVGRPTTDH